MTNCKLAHKGVYFEIRRKKFLVDLIVGNQEFKTNLVSIIDMESPNNDMLDDPTTYVLTVEILKRKSYSCQALRLVKGKDTGSSEDKAEYAFDITRVGHIYFIICLKIRRFDS